MKTNVYGRDIEYYSQEDLTNKINAIRLEMKNKYKEKVLRIKNNKSTPTDNPIPSNNTLGLSKVVDTPNKTTKDDPVIKITEDSKGITKKKN